MKLKRITLLVPDLRAGGAERVVINLANIFVQRGYAVDVVVLSAKGDFLCNLNHEIRVVDLKAERLRGAFIPLIRYLNNSRPDALVVNMWPLTLIGILARTLAQVSTRLIVVEHTTWSKDLITSTRFGRWVVSFTMHYFFPLADNIVAVSMGAADDIAHFAKLDRDSIAVIYNPVVGKLIPSGSEKLEPYEWWFGTHRRILAVGNLNPIKDYKTMLLAFIQLRKKIDARLLILGEGPCRLEIEELAKKLGLEGTIFMPGYTKDPFSFYLRTELHVISSRGEGFGNVIVEALAAGTPVVSTDCQSGPREILCDGKFGSLVPVGDVTALALAMENSLATEHDFEALKMRAQEFSIEKAADQYEKMFFRQTQVQRVL